MMFYTPVKHSLSGNRAISIKVHCPF